MGSAGSTTLGIPTMPDAFVAIAQRLAWETSGWKSIRITTHEVTGTGGRQDDEYVETSFGQRFFHSLFKDSNGREFPLAGYCDGKQCVSVRPGAEGRPKSLVVSKVFLTEEQFGYSERPIPYKFLSAGLTPLQDAIPHAAKLGESLVIGRLCDIYHVAGVKVGPKTLEFVYSLDRPTSVPLRLEIYKDAAALAGKKPVTVWEAETFDTEGKYHLARRSKTTNYQPDAATGAMKETGWRTYTVDSVEFDQPYPASTFWPKFEPGMAVIDTLKDKNYTVPGAEPASLTVNTAGTEAVPPTDWTAHAPAVGVGLGLCVLGAAGVAWWRGRGAKA